MSSGGSNTRWISQVWQTKKKTIRDLAFFWQVWDGPRGSFRRNGVASAYKTFHKIQKMVQFLNAGYVGTVPASLTPVHFPNIEKTRSAILWFSQSLELVLEAVPGATELQVPIKPFIKYKECSSFSFLGSLELIQSLWHCRIPSQVVFRMQKSEYLRMGQARREINVRPVILESFVPVRTHLHRGGCIAEA